MLDHEPDFEPAGASQESRYVQWAHQGDKKNGERWRLPHNLGLSTSLALSLK